MAVNVLDHLADPAAALGQARRALSPGGTFVAATASRSDSPELAHVWRPPLASFDAEDGPGLVASVFGQVQVERWDAPLVRLPDRAAVRDCLVARFVPHQAAVTAAEQVMIPGTITKRGAPSSTPARRAEQIQTVILVESVRPRGGRVRLP